MYEIVALTKRNGDGEHDYIYDAEGEVKLFHNKQEAVEFMKDNGLTEDDISKAKFLSRVGTCRRCGSPLFKSAIGGYTSQCFTCDEDFFGFEQG